MLSGVFLAVDKPLPAFGRYLPPAASAQRPRAVVDRSVYHDIPAEGTRIVSAFKADPLMICRKPGGQVQRAVEINKQPPAHPQRLIRPFNQPLLRPFILPATLDIVHEIRPQNDRIEVLSPGRRQHIRLRNMQIRQFLRPLPRIRKHVFVPVNACHVMPGLRQRSAQLAASASGLEDFHRLPAQLFDEILRHFGFVFFLLINPCIPMFKNFPLNISH